MYEIDCAGPVSNTQFVPFHANLVFEEGGE